MELCATSDCASRGARATGSGYSARPISTQVQQLLACEARPSPVGERRKSRRHPFPRLITVTPVGRDGTSPIGPRLTVVGKHLSEHGLDFYSQNPVPYRRVVVSLDAADGCVVHLLMDLSWCRFNRLGWYENGGRFLQVAPPPDEHEMDDIDGENALAPQPLKAAC